MKTMPTFVDGVLYPCADVMMTMVPMHSNGDASMSWLVYTLHLCGLAARCKHVVAA